MEWKNCCFWRDKEVGVHHCTFKFLSSGWTLQTSASMNGSTSDFGHGKTKFIYKIPNNPTTFKQNQSKPVLRQRMITKLVGISLLCSAIILIASNCNARLTALSMVALSIMATSSVVYSFTFNWKKVMCCEEKWLKNCCNKHVGYLVCFFGWISVQRQVPRELVCLCFSVRVDEVSKKRNNFRSLFSWPSSPYSVWWGV